MKVLSRRTFLKGMGVALALPHLEAMAAPGSGRSGRMPTRLAFLFTPNGMSMPQWRPGAEGPLGDLPKLLTPFQPVKSDISILSGLAQVNAAGLGDGPGDHARSAASWLTGVHPRKTAGSDIRNGISVDQVAAAKWAGVTLFPSLELGGERGQQAGSCDSGYSCAYSSTISWKSATQPMPKETDPRQVFDRLFGGGGQGEGDGDRARRLRRRTSILDFVQDEAKSLSRDLGGRDRMKLDEYLSGIREIEVRLQKMEKVSRSVEREKAPEGVPSDFREHLNLLGDMMILAFKTDLTRVCTFMLANEGSNRAYHEIGVHDGHHEVSHHGKDAEKIRKKFEIDRFHCEVVAGIVSRMKQVSEAGGTLLDHTLLVFGCGIGDGDRHNHDDLAILLAGKGGTGLPQGRHLLYPPKTPLNNLYLAMLDRSGIPVESLGDSTGRLAPLF